jgi:putative ABC transport system permease protein
MMGFLDDLRAAVRSLARRPAFTLAVALVLGLGTGLNAALFSFVDAVLLRSLPYPNEESLVTVWMVDPLSPLKRAPPLPDEFFVLEEKARSFAHLGAYVANEEIGFDLSQGGAPPERVPGAAVTPGFFAALGVAPIHGRVFGTEEELPGGEPVVVLGHQLWRSRFGADPAVVGRRIALSGIARTVVGVMPPGFDFPGADLWVQSPLEVSRAMNLPLLVTYNLRVIARLKDGVSPEAAQAEMDGIGRGLREEGISRGDYAPRVVSLRELLLGDARRALAVLFAAAGVVLLITCGNVASLVLGRLIARRPELALRLVAGATRRRLLSQLALESLALGLLGGVAGLAVCFVGLRGLFPLIAESLPRNAEPRVDARVLGFLLAVSALTGLAAGVLPAWRRSAGLSATLRDQGGASGRSRLWGMLVAAQLALTFVLLAGGGLMARSLYALLHRDLGFAPDHVLTMQLVLNRERSPTEEDRTALVERIVARIAALPRVTGAAASTGLPLRGGGHGMLFEVEGREYTETDQLPFSEAFEVTPGFFAALGAPLVAGRLFTAADDARAPGVIIVDAELAERFWPSGRAVGQRIRISGTWREIVGVVRPIEHGGLREDSGTLLYVPLAQVYLPAPFVQILVRTEADPMAVAPAVRAAVGEVDSRQPVTGVASLEEVIRASLARDRSIAVLLGLFSLLALVLALTGVYALVTFAAERRRREIGIRIALGARPIGVLALVLRQGMLVTGAGLAAGLAAALASTRALEHFVYGLAASDPVTFLLAGFVLAAAVLAAALIPGIRALRVDPARVLRPE